jgi:uncharacterized protein YjbI with pentapeptide repeats
MPVQDKSVGESACLHHAMWVDHTETCCDMSGTKLFEANLFKADLSKANLFRAQGLTDEQLSASRHF